MLEEKYVVKHIFYTYHPDFIQDENEPRGYRVLETGRWVVEWGVRKFIPSNLPQPYTHYSRSFETEQDAIAFEKKLRCGIYEKNYVIINKDNLYFLNQ